MVRAAITEFASEGLETDVGGGSRINNEDFGSDGRQNAVHNATVHRVFDRLTLCQHRGSLMECFSDRRLLGKVMDSARKGIVRHDAGHFDAEHMAIGAKIEGSGYHLE